MTSRQKGTQRTQEHPEVTWCADGMTFEKHTKDRSNKLTKCRCIDELCEVWHATRKMCACVRTVRCYLYTSSRVHDSCHCLDAKADMADERARLQRESELRSTLATVETVLRRQQVSLSLSEHESVVVRSYHLSHHF